MPTDEEIQRQKIEAELATAVANQRAAEATQKAAEAAQREAEAKAETAEAAADKAKNDAAGDPENDPEVVAARKKARLADLAKEQAASDAAARQSAVPALPTIATIAPEVDKSPKVDADSGTGIANLVASTALDITGQEIGRALIAALDAAHVTKATIWIVDHLDIARRDVDRLAMSVRLDAFTSAFTPDKATEAPPPAPSDELESFTVPLPSAELASFAVGAGTSLAKFGVELVGALRSRYALYGRKVELDRTALVTSTLRALRNPLGNEITVRWPTVSTVSDAPLVRTFANACNARDAFAGTYLMPDVPGRQASQGTTRPCEGARRQLRRLRHDDHDSCRPGRCVAPGGRRAPGGLAPSEGCVGLLPLPGHHRKGGRCDPGLWPRPRHDGILPWIRPGLLPAHEGRWNGRHRWHRDQSKVRDAAHQGRQARVRQGEVGRLGTTASTA